MSQPSKYPTRFTSNTCGIVGIIFGTLASVGWLIAIVIITVLVFGITDAANDGMNIGEFFVFMGMVTGAPLVALLATGINGTLSFIALLVCLIGLADHPKKTAVTGLIVGSASLIPSVIVVILFCGGLIAAINSADNQNHLDRRNDPPVIAPVEFPKKDVPKNEVPEIDRKASR